MDPEPTSRDLAPAANLYAARGFVALRRFLGPDLVTYLARYSEILAQSGGVVEAVDGPLAGSMNAYGDRGFDALLESKRSLVAEIVGRPLAPTYTYLRTYFAGQALAPHRDRPACEHSVSLLVSSSSAEPWPLMLEDLEGSTVSIPLEPGDAVLYRGMAVTHWRNQLDDGVHTQLFMHYVDAEGPYRNEVYDRRERLGASRQPGHRTMVEEVDKIDQVEEAQT